MPLPSTHMRPCKSHDNVGLVASAPTLHAGEMPQTAARWLPLLLAPFLLAASLGVQSAAAQSAAAQSVAAQLAAVQSARSISIEPGYQPARDLLCTLYVRSRQFAKAVAEAQQARLRNPDDQEPLYQQIMAERRLGEKAKLEPLVARLNELRTKDQSRRTTYLLQEAASAPEASR